MCILFAATYPTRTSALVLQGSFARLVQAPDQEFRLSTRGSALYHRRVRRAVGHGCCLCQLLSQRGSRPCVERAAGPLRAQWRQSKCNGGYRRNACGDRRSSDPPEIGVPTLVVHSTGDAVISVEHGRYLAEHIAGARYIELTSEDHLAFRAGESGAVDDIEEFLTGQRPVQHPDRILTTVLFTDIVDSTRRAVELGDQRWRVLLDQHDGVMRQHLDRFGGREVNTTGDGFLAAFDGPQLGRCNAQLPWPKRCGSSASRSVPGCIPANANRGPATSEA